MLEAFNPYITLGIKPGATKDEILQAYRAMCKRWHPDVCKDPEAVRMMALINHAYDLLTKPQPVPPPPPPQPEYVFVVRRWYGYAQTTAAGDTTSTYGGYW